MMGIRYAAKARDSTDIYYHHRALHPIMVIRSSGGVIMAMRRNLLREKLDAGKPTVGTHILSAWPTLVELIGHSKQYDYDQFTAEYAPFTMHDLDNLGRSFELMNMAGMIKIEQTQYTHQAMRAIGSGFQSVLFADIRSVEDARLAVDAVRAETTMAKGA